MGIATTPFAHVEIEITRTLLVEDPLHAANAAPESGEESMSAKVSYRTVLRSHFDIFLRASLHRSRLVSLHCRISTTVVADMLSGGFARNSRSARNARAAVRIGKSKKGLAIRESESISSAKQTMSTSDRADCILR